jgi:hypothetical protein
MQSHLTPSRKRRQAARLDVDWLDAMNDSCRALETFGLALGAAAERAETQPAELWTGLGELILREVETVRNLTDEVRKEAQ